MNLKIIIIEILLSILLFILMNYLKLKKINRIDTILIHNIIIIILASLFSKLKNYMILGLLFYIVIDYIYTFIITKQGLLKNEKIYYKNLFLTLILGIIIYEFFLLKVKYAFVDMEVFKNFIWVLIILYGYQKLNIKSIKLDEEEKENLDNTYKEFIIINYAKLKNKYSYLIKTNSYTENILYSFMIYETYLKSSNFINYLKNKLIKNKRYGIMNLESDHKLTDEESIVLVKENLESKLNKLKRTKNKDEIIEKLIKVKYKQNKEVKEINKILNIIIDFKNKD